jgi:hypothetical protein
MEFINLLIYSLNILLKLIIRFKKKIKKYFIKFILISKIFIICLLLLL